MPNGGIPYGCWPCEHRDLTRSLHSPQYCTFHKIEVSMYHICNDVKRGDPTLKLSEILAREGRHTINDMLFWWCDLTGYDGYPPPRVLVPLGLIEEYRYWNEEEKKQAEQKAEKLARKYYEEWRSRE